MLTLVICEDDHECFDQRVPQMLVNGVDVLWVNIIHINFFILLCVERIILTVPTFGVVIWRHFGSRSRFENTNSSSLCRWHRSAWLFVRMSWHLLHLVLRFQNTGFRSLRLFRLFRFLRLVQLRSFSLFDVPWWFLIKIILFEHDIWLFDWVHLLRIKIKLQTSSNVWIFTICNWITLWKILIRPFFYE